MRISAGAVVDRDYGGYRQSAPEGGGGSDPAMAQPLTRLGAVAARARACAASRVAVSLG